MDNNFYHEITDNKYYVLIREPETEIDYLNISDFNSVLLQGVELGYQKIYIDCRNLTYIDSIGLGNLMILSKKAEVVLLNIRPEIKEALKVTKFSPFFTFE